MEAVRQAEDPDGKCGEWTSKDMYKKLIDNEGLRGRKAADRLTYLTKLKFYLEVSKANALPEPQAFALCSLVVLELESYAGGALDCLKQPRWLDWGCPSSQLIELSNKNGV